MTGVLGYFACLIRLGLGRKEMGDAGYQQAVTKIVDSAFACQR